MSRRTSLTCFLAAWIATANAGHPQLVEVQPEPFQDRHALANAFADADGDGDLDLAVSYTSGAIRLYWNDAGITWTRLRPRPTSCRT